MYNTDKNKREVPRMEALQRQFTVEDIYALPEGERMELIDGCVYDMAPPVRIHQKLVSELTQAIGSYIKTRGGDCEVYPAPFAVFLNKDNRNYVEPDVSVICDKDKLDDRGCNGAPDWVIEIVSPATQQRDYSVKLFKYRGAGVREYWIVNPATQTVTVYDFENEQGTSQYRFEEEVPVCIYEDFRIRIADML